MDTATAHNTTRSFNDCAIKLSMELRQELSCTVPLCTLNKGEPKTHKQYFHHLEFWCRRRRPSRELPLWAAPLLLLSSLEELPPPGTLVHLQEPHRSSSWCSRNTACSGPVLRVIFTSNKIWKNTFILV